jgi:hypothetical protein
MGLAMPGGVQAPTLGFELDPFQVQALDELGQNTMSPNNAGNAAAPGRITPRESGRITPWEAGGSAYTPVPGVGINPPPPLISQGMSFCFQQESLQVLILGFARQMQQPHVNSPSLLPKALVTVSFFL